MTESKTECNDLTKNKIKYWCENKSALFFDHLHSTLRSQDRNRCHEMIDPKIDVRAPFWRTFQWSVASHPFWEFGQWNSQQSPLWLTHVTFSTNTHPSTLQASTMQYKSALPASALITMGSRIKLRINAGVKSILHLNPEISPSKNANYRVKNIVK